MGNQNCCVRANNPSKTLANFDIINEDKFETAPQNMQITENVLNLEAPIIEEKTIAVTENSTTEVTPDSGKVLSKVTIITNIQTDVPEEVSEEDVTEDDVTDIQNPGKGVIAISGILAVLLVVCSLWQQPILQDRNR